MTDEPTPRPGVEDVRPHVEKLFSEILAAQCAKGEAKYGTRLQTFNGRDALNDALAELVDAVQYVTQMGMERDEIVRRAQAMAKELRKREYTDLCCGDIREVLSAWDALGLSEGE